MRLLCTAVSMTLGVALVGPPVGATKPKSKPHTAAAKRGASAHNAAADRDPAPCNLGAHPKLFLFYAGVGGDRAFKYLKGCHGEVVIGEKHEKPHHPHPAAEPPKSLKVLLGDVREALSDFHTYWSDRTARISELKMVRDSLAQRGTLDEDLAKKLDATRALPRSRLG